MEFLLKIWKWKKKILSPQAQASQDDIVPSTVKGSIPGVVIPPLDAYLDLTTQPILVLSNL